MIVVMRGNRLTKKSLVVAGLVLAAACGVVSTEILEAVGEPASAGPMDLHVELLDGDGRPLTEVTADELEVRSGQDLFGVSDQWRRWVETGGWCFTSTSC